MSCFAYDDRYRRVYALGARTWRHPAPRAEFERFLRTAKLRPGRAVDLGCGEGIDAIWLATQSWRVLGVDASVTAMSRARELSAEAKVSADFAVADLRSLPLATSADLAVSIASLHMFVDAAERHAVLSEAHRILRDGGRLFVDCLGRSRSREGRAMPAGAPVEYSVMVDGRPVPVTLPAVPSTRLTDRQLREELAAAAFTTCRLYRIGPPAYRRIICWARKGVLS
jgi:SAM-dependent methyltransferase